MDPQKINDVTTFLIMSVGKAVGVLDSFEAEMVVIEGLVAGLIGSAAIRHNRQPDEIIVALCSGIKERTERLIYGARQ